MSSLTVTYTLAPPSPDYVPGPEHPPSPDYVPGPEYPEYVASSDDEIPVEDQPLPGNASPTALSSGYVADSDPEDDLEEEPEEDPADCPADRGDDDDDEDDNDEEEESSEEDDDEEGEHLAPSDSAAATPPPPPPRSPQTKALIAEFASVPTPLSPPPSLLSPWSYPLPQIPSPPLLLPSPPTHTSPTYVEAPLGYRAAMESWELYVHCEDAQDDRALLRAQVSLLTRERRYFRSMASSYEREAVIDQQAWSHLEDRSMALEASIMTLEAQVEEPDGTIQPSPIPSKKDTQTDEKGMGKGEPLEKSLKDKPPKKVVIHDDYPDQTIIIEGNLSIECRSRLVVILRKHADAFA
ncbi:hypothetical protein Tco_0823762 [Tanacetum coccineum]|uniref:Uncharacterized protein n=1 Tax=Tanacetum coccineum TaxID=301880 RepID=A0ABQ5AMX6_9ASTR